MRILVLSDLYPPVAFGGYELECAALVDRLRERHDVHVLTTALRRDEAGAESGVERVLPFMGGRLRPALTAPAAALAAARAARATVAAFGPDLVYVSNGAALPQAAIQVAAQAGAPVVVRFSELWYARTFLAGDRFLRHLGPGDRGARAAWALVQRTVNRHPALRLDAEPRIRASISWASEALRDLAGVPATVQPVQQRVIRPATPRFDLFAASERRPADPPVVAYVGRLTEQKGAVVAVEAVAALGRPVALEMAGPVAPALGRRLEALAAGRGVDLRLTGPQPPEAVAALLARAAAVLVPSVEPEAFPLVTMEAALAGAPLVASDAGGIPEGLADGEHALLVAPGDAAAAAAALAAILDDPAQARRRAARARRRARTFTLDAYLDASEELIDAAAEPLPRYAVVTPVRDEIEHFARTAESLIAQEHRPVRWVVVDDGSTDGTAELARSYADAHDWITLTAAPERHERARGAPIVRAFEHGRGHVAAEHDVVVKLDGDLFLPPNYFRWVLSVFGADPRAGIVAGTPLVPDPRGGWRLDVGRQHATNGVAKAYRVAFLEEIGGLPQSMGWDGIDEYQARARGWTIHVLTELTLLHYRVRGSKQAWWRARWEEGRGNHFMGYRADFLALRAAYRMLVERPPVLGGLAIAAGFAWSALTRRPQLPDPAARALLRDDQRRRLTAFARRGADARALPPGGGPAYTETSRSTTPR